MHNTVTSPILPSTALPVRSVASYHLLSSSNIIEFTQEANKLVKEGWAPGNLSTTLMMSDGDTVVVYSQHFTKVDIRPPEDPNQLPLISQ